MSRRLTVVTGIFPPDIGGPASYVPVICGELASAGWDAEVISWSDELGHDDRAYPFRVIRIRRGSNKLLRFLGTIWAIWRSARRTRRLFVNGLAMEATLAAWLTGSSTIHKIVGDYAWEKSRNRGWFKGSLDEFQTANKGIRPALFAWMRTWPIRMADKVIVPSRYLERIVLGWGARPGSVQVIYNSVEFPDTGSAPVLPSYGGKTVVTICRLVPWKGVELLIEAVGRLDKVRLVVVGDGPLLADLKFKAESSGLADRVLFLGHLRRNEAMAVLREAGVFVLNSSYEGLPHVVLEAMYCGVPVVATRAGGTPEVVEDGITGRLVEYGDVGALSEALRASLSEPGATDPMTAAAKRMVGTRWAFKTMVGSTLRALEGLGEPPASGAGEERNGAGPSLGRQRRGYAWKG